MRNPDNLFVVYYRPAPGFVRRSFTSRGWYVASRRDHVAAGPFVSRADAVRALRSFGGVA